MKGQNAVLAILAAAPASATAICEASKSRRKPVLLALGKLMQKKLVARLNPGNAGNFGRIEPVYGVTKKGAEFVAAGKRVTSGANGPFTGIAKRNQDTFRARLWRALRIKKKATIPELIEIVRTKTDGESVESNALHYLRALTRAGVVAELPTREKGYALTSPGFIRWALVRDLGPLAPIVSKKHLIDLNAPSHAATIAYAEVERKEAAEAKP